MSLLKYGIKIHGAFAVSAGNGKYYMTAFLLLSNNDLPAAWSGGRGLLTGSFTAALRSCACLECVRAM